MNTLNQAGDGYRGIWYSNQPSHDEYVYKYSGGLGTYCAKHQPFAVHRPEVGRTFFCYGGTTGGVRPSLLHMVSYYDHARGVVPRPTLLLDKQTDDAHDNPVISVDGEGFVWIFSTAHGVERPSFIHRSRRPLDVSEFERIDAGRREVGRDVPFDNFSYWQAWHEPGAGFACFFTWYHNPATRTIFFTRSDDGVRWAEPTRLAAIEEGHYQVSARCPRAAGAAFNYHPAGRGVNWRTNLYYVETTDNGESWQAADGTPLTLPLTEVANAALVHDFAADATLRSCASLRSTSGLLVYLKDICFDAAHRPIVLLLTSPGYESGPGNSPRTWTTARWTGREWEIRPAFTSDSNYDSGSLYVEPGGGWRVIAPTEPGPQPFNPGGEMVAWASDDAGASWRRERQLTADSEFNHTYARRPVNAHADFYALWADGHGRRPSASSLYFCDRAGEVRRLPREMSGDFAEPEPL